MGLHCRKCFICHVLGNPSARRSCSQNMRCAEKRIKYNAGLQIRSLGRNVLGCTTPNLPHVQKLYICWEQNIRSNFPRNTTLIDSVSVCTQFIVGAGYALVPDCRHRPNVTIAVQVSFTTQYKIYVCPPHPRRLLRPKGPVSGKQAIEEGVALLFLLNLLIDSCSR